MPRLKPTKGGCVIVRNDVQRELMHTTASTDSWKRLSTEILDELTFTLSLTLSQMLLYNNALLILNVQVYHQAEKKPTESFNA